MSVQEVVLFVSSTSRASTPVLQFVGKNQIPVGIVRLDTPEDRQIAATGKYFQIVNVPALLVIYDDGNLQLFVGQEKIITWFQQIIQKSMQHPHPQQNQQHHQQHPHNRPPPQPLQPKKNPVFVSEESSSSESSSDEEVYTPPKKNKTSSRKEKSSKKHKKQNKIKKKKPIQFEEEEEEEEIEFFNNEDNKPQSTGLEVGPSYLDKRNPQMENTHKLAQQMQKARQESLSFEEEG